MNAIEKWPRGCAVSFATAEHDQWAPLPYPNGMAVRYRTDLGLESWASGCDQDQARASAVKFELEGNRARPGGIGLLPSPSVADRSASH